MYRHRVPKQHMRTRSDIVHHLVPGARVPGHASFTPKLTGVAWNVAGQYDQVQANSDCNRTYQHRDTSA
jgi:hypothetical protein